ncbi:hypothetical protein DPMN_018462 [Dreissena polymorpha]|uniref:Uncharacterized protein n=1 Tax=Dreissena polymorpha TaxID=45954 RepID=A0A9D4NGL8_DREPO|nr:hypothetical protein DPMN_018462 [Dreissena polymorpha]
MPRCGRHFFQPTIIIFEFFHDFIGTNPLTKLHEDRIINFYYSNIRKNAQPPCHLTNLLTKLLTRQMLTPHATRRTTDKRLSQKLTMSTLSSIGANQQTNRPTDQQTNRQTGQKQYVPHYYSGGHKNSLFINDF